MPPTEQARWFAEELQPHESRLRSWLQARFSSLQDIDDIVQEAYLKVLRARATGKILHPKSYLFNTARNTALDRIRHERVVSFEHLTDFDRPSVLEDDTCGVPPNDDDIELETLASAIRALPDRCREVLLLRKYHGLSHEEIAARLGISLNTVNSQITTAMMRCRQHFRSRGLLRKEAS